MLILVLVSAGTVYAFTLTMVTTNLRVKEPLRLVDVAGTGRLSGIAPFCDLLVNTATCAFSLFAGEGGSITVQVHNRASSTIIVTPKATSSSTDVSITAPSPKPVSSNAEQVFSFPVTVSASASTPLTDILTMTFSR